MQKFKTSLPMGERFGSMHTALKNLKLSHHNCEAASHARWNKLQPSWTSIFLSNIWTADFFTHQVLGHSKRQNGVIYLTNTSTYLCNGLSSCSVLQRMLTFYIALKNLTELCIVILTFNLILLYMASCPRWPSRWLITARSNFNLLSHRLLLQKLTLLTLMPTKCVYMSYIDWWISLFCLC